MTLYYRQLMYLAVNFRIRVYLDITIYMWKVNMYGIILSTSLHAHDMFHRTTHGNDVLYYTVACPRFQYPAASYSSRTYPSTETIALESEKTVSPVLQRPTQTADLLPWWPRKIPHNLNHIDFSYLRTRKNNNISNSTTPKTAK